MCLALMQIKKQALDPTYAADIEENRVKQFVLFAHPAADVLATRAALWVFVAAPIEAGFVVSYRLAIWFLLV